MNFRQPAFSSRARISFNDSSWRRRCSGLRTGTSGRGWELRRLRHSGLTTRHLSITLAMQVRGEIQRLRGELSYKEFSTMLRSGRFTEGFFDSSLRLTGWDE